MVRPGIRLLILMILLTSAGSLAIGASGFDTELHHRILNSDTASQPWISGDKVMFTYSPARTTQVVSLAFEHEDYREFHTFEKNPHGVFVLTVDVPEAVAALHYRLVVDGLWTIDPNASTERDRRGILVSSVTIPADHSTPHPGVTTRLDGSRRFVFVGPAGSRVSLIGDFNRWDPYLTPMEESWAYPGIYEVTLNIPADAEYYRFVVDGREITDPANPVIARNGWGVDASPLPADKQ